MSDTRSEAPAGKVADAAERVVGGVVDRARALLVGLDRRDRLETARAFVGWLGGERAGGRLSESAREVLLRALRRAADPVNYAILRRLDPQTGSALESLMADTGLARVAASERVYDLVQVGLAARDLIGDEIRITALGQGLVELVEAWSREAGERLDGALDGTPARSEERPRDV